MYVLDASVILKWYLQEDDTEKALKFKQGFVYGSFNLALPDLILYEVPNALKYDKNVSLEAAGEAVSALIDLGIDIIVPTKSIIQNALMLAYQGKTSFYDAAYVALASEMGYYFVTADVKLYKKIKDLKFVKLLSELTSI